MYIIIFRIIEVKDSVIITKQGILDSLHVYLKWEVPWCDQSIKRIAKDKWQLLIQCTKRSLRIIFIVYKVTDYKVLHYATLREQKF